MTLIFINFKCGCDVKLFSRCGHSEILYIRCVSINAHTRKVRKMVDREVEILITLIAVHTYGDTVIIVLITIMYHIAAIKFRSISTVDPCTYNDPVFSKIAL